MFFRIPIEKYVVWLSPGGCGGVSQAYPRYAEICPGFPPPQAARVTVGEKGLLVVWYNSDMVKAKAQGREIRIGRILICVRVIIGDHWSSLVITGGGH